MIFPVKAPYQVVPDISKYQGNTFNRKPDPFYLEQKKIELDRFEYQLMANMPEASSSLSSVCEYLDLEALHLEEDIAILKEGILQTICFCFPSGFVPSKKIGMNFFDMHMPVADGERLRSASEKLTALISKEGNMFRRHVWTVTALPGLSQHPSIPRPEPNKIADLYFRTETQTTIALRDEVCLFLVKVDMQPLQMIWENHEKREILLASINSMTDEILSYKNLHQIKGILNR